MSIDRRNILICGGAGYIGSHMAQLLSSQGHSIHTLDNFSTGHRAAVRWGTLVEADLLDSAALDHVFGNSHFDAVIHFCARSLVGESIHDPYGYYENNVCGTLNLLQAMHKHGVSQLVFSSTAAVFGHPMSAYIGEDHPTNPINPYGASKLMVERILADAFSAYGVSSVALRYFNAAGALAEHGIGEAHACETHLIPNVLKAALTGSADLKVFGDDYDTIDGTCVRDYVHVQDLAQAHALALEFMDREPGAHTFNLGNGRGFSVKQVIDAASAVCGRSIPYSVAPRRAGDPATLVAASDKARTLLGWTPKWTELQAIIDSAWRWHIAQAF